MEGGMERKKASERKRENVSERDSVV